ncbi:opine metallophore biosynthesis dehydrogenase [Paenibacillus sp. NPDC057967]|uniref:opine metallophore biosynthesis dehydrogenase n=1 Tax=Paenibacillus sp. NPDC057967 TaxID=3346293 RepID=UPI0036DA48E3
MNPLLTTPFGNTLVIGAGPAGIHAAIDWSQRSVWIGLLNREGSHANRIEQELSEQDDMISVDIQVPRARHLSGEVQLNRFYNGYDGIEDLWHTLVLCTPGDSYMEVIRSLKLEALPRLKTIILLSPGIGSNLLVQSSLGSLAAKIEIISCSTYYASSRFPSNQATVLKSVVNGLKRKVTVSSNRLASPSLLLVKELLESRHVQCEITSNPLEAECRSITTYVHPPLFMNDFSLNEVFGRQPSRKFLYKLFPEGPITQHTIRSMVLLWKEISSLLRGLGVQPLNLLQFLNDDNYPVHETTLSRSDIENYSDMDPIQQQYLLYIRYSAILIDPFSEPDSQGKYADFSAISYQQAAIKNGYWTIPRIPYEDYKRLKMLHAVGQRLGLNMPHAHVLINRFESKLASFIQEAGADQVHPDLLQDQSEEQAEAILLTLKVSNWSI